MSFFGEDKSNSRSVSYGPTVGLLSVHRYLIISASLTNCSWIPSSRRRGRKYFVVLNFKIVPLRSGTYHAIRTVNLW